MVMYSAGLTLQYDRMSVRTAEETTLFDDVYLCPQANLMWMINPQKGRMLGFMYQCTVSDMPYSVINGYKNFSTPYHYTTGNPDLQTPVSHEAMARFAVNSHISMMLMYGYEIIRFIMNTEWTRRMEASPGRDRRMENSEDSWAHESSSLIIRPNGGTQRCRQLQCRIISNLRQRQ